MNPVSTDEMREVLYALHYRPAISVILPFEPKMNLKAEILHTLKNTADAIEQELHGQYPEELCNLVMRKLNNIIAGLNFNTHKKSIAIYVSPVFEKVVYLDISMNERIVIDETFEIRDLVYSKKKSNRFLLLVLGSSVVKMYVGNGNCLVQIITNGPQPATLHRSESKDKATELPGVASNETALKKFLYRVDCSLDMMINVYQVPLFVIGAENVLSYFKKLTRHNDVVIEYIHGDYEHTDAVALNDLFSSYINNWEGILQKHILNKLREASVKKKLVYGMTRVWKEALLRQPQLLVVEKDYTYVARVGAGKEIIYPAPEAYDRFSCIKDAVDDVIEKVLTAGGDVEFVENGTLAEYDRIALIRYD